MLADPPHPHFHYWISIYQNNGLYYMYTYVLTPYPVLILKTDFNPKFVPSLPFSLPPPLSFLCLQILNYWLHYFVSSEIKKGFFFFFVNAFKYQNTEIFFYKAREDFNRTNKSSGAKVACVLCITGFLASCTAVGPGAA